MTSNLIQNYIISKPVSAIQSKLHLKQNKDDAQKKPVPDFDIQHELDNRTFIKPLQGKGRLLKENIFNMPAIMVKDAIYDAKAFKHAVKGEANDHELGRLNDVGLMLGGLAIAGYLATKKQTPMTKGMEFVGLASFLASMSIWPKIAIQLPAYLIHGVNVQKQYEDSFGRKKPFYQDPQFIPWDLYTDEEIQKIGDDLNVPKDIPNRREFIQEKMRKIAIQNNTLWMLTAGFATPIMSALICNQTEPFLNKFLNNIQNKKADRILNNLDSYSKKYNDHLIEKNLDKVFELYKNKPINKEVEKCIMQAFTDGLDLVTAQSVKADLRKFFNNGRSYFINEKSAKIISKNIRELFKGKNYSEEFLKSVLPGNEALINILIGAEVYDKKLTHLELKKVNNIIVRNIEQKVIEYNKNVAPDKQEDPALIKKIILSNKLKNHPIEKIHDRMVMNTLNASVQARFKNIAKIFDEFKSKNYALDEYAFRKVGSAPETVIANYWNDTAKTLFKILGMKPKEIEKAKISRDVMGNLLREKIENIVADEKTYKKVINDIIKKVAVINDRIKSSDIANSLLTKESTNNRYDELVTSIFDNFAIKLQDSNIDFLKTSAAISDIKTNNHKGTLKNLQKLYVKDRLLGVKSSFYRLINTFDFYRRIATEVNTMDVLNDKPKEIKEELVELCKEMTLRGHSSDNATKFFMMRNPNPSSKEGPLVIKNGKIVNEFLHKPVERTDIPGDKYFYQNAMTMMFDKQMHKNTLDALHGTSIEKEMQTYRELILDKIGGERYFAKPNHLIRPANRTGSDTIFLLTGIAPDEFFYKAGLQAFNTRKWLKIFGGFGAGLLGLTILAQFFFGKMKNPEIQPGVKND